MSMELTKSATAAWCDQYHFTMAGAWFPCSKHMEHKTSADGGFGIKHAGDRI